MKKQITVLLSALILFSFGCKKNNNNTSNSTSGNFTLKYELITSSPITNNYVSIMYENGTQQPETDNSFVAGNTYWSKEVTVTTPNRPFYAILPAVAIYLSSPGTVTGNIYVNGSQVAHTSNPTQTSSGTTFAVCGMQYLVY